MKISTIARYIDQPLIINNLQDKMPVLLLGGVFTFGAYDIYENKKKRSKMQGIKNAIVLSATTLFSLIGAKGLAIGNKQIFKGLLNSTPKEELIKAQTQAVQEFLAQNKVAKEIELVLNKVKEKALNPKEIDILINLPESKSKNMLFSKILPKPENLSSTEIFHEIKRLSLMGLIPVVAGISSGIFADKITGTTCKKSSANKIKEGFYQYFANIFLCNVGAAAALFTLEKMEKTKIIKELTPIKRLVGILAGITLTGIIGGSFIANYLSKKLIDPIFNQKHKHNEGIYSERKPEFLDIALHTDDIATAGVLSGFKWIEPALPLMYLVSGYRAGIGYRNNE